MHLSRLCYWTWSAAFALALVSCDAATAGGGADAGDGGDDLGAISDVATDALGGSDTAGVDISDTTGSDVSAQCPANPVLQGTCSADNLKCEYGQECCCGKCYPSTVCTCTGGQWGCYATDACMIPPGYCDDAGIDASYDQAGGACESDTVCKTGEFCQRASSSCGGTGTCTVKPQACPAIYQPVCGCDGKTYGNDCEAAGKGVSVAASGACPTGCLTDSACKVGEFCQLNAFACDGAGSCTVKSVICDDIYAPVCGCDNKTYANACSAQAAGMSIAKNGACAAKCTASTDCTGGQFCSKPAGQCAGNGLCSPFPDACDAIYDPICGCDGKTYSSACTAALQGKNVSTKGACVP